MRRSGLDFPTGAPKPPGSVGRRSGTDWSSANRSRARWWRSPFGVWLDIGVGHPALLLVPEMEGAQRHRITFDDYPAIGRTLEGRIVGIDEVRCAISVSQRYPEGVPWAAGRDAGSQ